MRGWLVILTVVDALLLVVGAYLAVGALDVALRLRVFMSGAIAALFFALPVFCIAAPLAAWRAYGTGKGAANAIALVLAPVVYALFLLLFVASA